MRNVNNNHGPIHLSRVFDIPNSRPGRRNYMADRVGMISGKCMPMRTANEIVDLAMAAYAEDAMPQWFANFYEELRAGMEPLQAATVALDEVRS